MTHPTASVNYGERQAGSLRTGDLLLLPDATRTAEIASVAVDNDDFGTPALVRATLTGGGVLRIAAGSTVLIQEPASAPESEGVSTASAGESPADVPSAPDAEESGATNDDAGAPAPADGGASLPAVVVPPPPASPPAV